MKPTKVFCAIFFLICGISHPVWCQWTETQQLIPSEVMEYARYGASVSIDGNQAVVGAPGADAAYVLKRTTGTETWVEVARLSGAGTYLDFGESVAISGDRIAVGAPEELSSTEHTGAVYIFEKDGGGNWVQTDKLIGSAVDPSVLGYTLTKFGREVALSANQLVTASNFRAYGGGIHAGGDEPVFIFEKEGADWNRTGYFSNGGSPVHVTGEYLTGIRKYILSLDIESNTVVIGWSTHADIPGMGSQGEAEIYEKSGGGIWGFSQSLSKRPLEAYEHIFGSSVSLSADRIAVSAFVREYSGGEIGPSYTSIFRRDTDGTWRVEDGVSPYIAFSFGPIDIFRSTTESHLITAEEPYHYEAVSFHERTTSGNWNFIEFKRASYPYPSDGGVGGAAFGASVSIFSNYAIVGSPQRTWFEVDEEGHIENDTEGVGAVYIYKHGELIVSPPPPPPAEDCHGVSLSGIFPNFTPAFIDFLCFQIDYKLIKELNECLYCNFNPPIPRPDCYQCPDVFKEFGQAYEITFSYDNSLDETIKTENFFTGQEGLKHIENKDGKYQELDFGQPREFEPGKDQNVFSLIAAPGETLHWIVKDEKGQIGVLSIEAPGLPEIKIFPNTNDGIFKLSIGNIVQEKSASIQINNSKGYTIAAYQASLPYEKEINLRNYGKGIYYIQVQIGQAVETKKIVVK